MNDITPVAPKIAFLCTRNAGRSQMAAGFARQFGGSRVNVYSGGSEPADRVNEVVVMAMAEVGIDVSDEMPKPWSQDFLRSADVIVTMGCKDACPLIPGKRYEDWDVPNPAGLELSEVRVVRDEIAEHVRLLLKQLDIAAPTPRD